MRASRFRVARSRNTAPGCGGVNQAVSETDATASQVQTAAADLSKQAVQLSGQLSGEMATFVAGVRAPS